MAVIRRLLLLHLKLLFQKTENKTNRFINSKEMGRASVTD